MLWCHRTSIVGAGWGRVRGGGGLDLWRHTAARDIPYKALEDLFHELSEEVVGCGVVGKVFVPGEHLDRWELWERQLRLVVALALARPLEKPMLVL